MSILSSIKDDAKKSGQNKGKFMYFREGQKYRIRFLNDMEEGFEVKFHDSFSDGVNVPCQEIFGRECEYCEMDNLRTRTLYCWSVWDYDAKDVKLFMFAMNNCSPLAALMAMYENYGTLTDRDYVLSVTGKGADKTFSVVPMDKNKFRNEKAKPYSEKTFLKMLDKAFPADDSGDDEDEDEDEKPVKSKSKSKAAPVKTAKKTTKKKQEDEEEEDEDESSEYEEMSAKELYKLCKDRDIDCEPKKNVKYYINLLEEDDKANDDWDEEEEDDDAEDWDE